MLLSGGAVPRSLGAAGVEPGAAIASSASHDVFSNDDGHTFRFEDGSMVRLSGIVPENRPIALQGVRVPRRETPR